MNIEHDTPPISPHEFNQLESHNLKGFLNIKDWGTNC